jgi:hypothetical protein
MDDLTKQSANTITTLMGIINEWFSDSYECAFCGGEFELGNATYHCLDADCPGNVAEALLGVLNQG